ncbi:S8 family serine peptidase [Candidatus Neomarinimicrobiota bacterium]
MRNNILIILMISVFSFLITSCETDNNNIISSTEPNLQQVGDDGFTERSLEKKSKGMVGINVLLNTSINDEYLAELSNYGHVMDTFVKLNAVRIKAKESELEGIRALSFVKSANPDAERHGRPVDRVSVDNFAGGMSTWNLDVINVTEGPSGSRSVTEDGSGVYIGVLDSGLLDSWRSYFADERIAEDYAKSFGGGGASGTNVSEQPNKWEHDQDSHGTHVTSTILGYSLGGTTFVNGVAPMSTVIPVKVLNQNGSGWSSVIARGIMYMAELKEGPLSGAPVVINMSLGGSYFDPLEEAAIDYAIDAGVIIVASAGNGGEAGMGYPGAYQPVISVAMSGWDREWEIGTWWFTIDIPEGSAPASSYYIDDWSSRELPGQELDVTAPGSWIVGPYQTNSGQLSYYYLGGTSMASPHVAGLVALMAQNHVALTASEAESLLKGNTLWIIGFDSDEQGSGLVQADLVLAAM